MGRTLQICQASQERGTLLLRRDHLQVEVIPDITVLACRSILLNFNLNLNMIARPSAKREDGPDEGNDPPDEGGVGKLRL